MVMKSFSFRLLKIAMPVLLVSAVSWAWAVPNQASQEVYILEQCLGLPDTERLACYDRIALRHAQEPSEQPFIVKGDEQTVTTDVQQNNLLADHESVEDGETVVLMQEAVVREAPPPASPMEHMWELREDTQRPQFSLQAYNPNYILFAQHGDRVNRRPTSPAPGHQSTNSKDYRHLEGKFQLSVKSKLVHSLFRENDSIWFGYTQVSHWQVWSPNISRPFRATSYKPEVMYIMPIQYRFGDSSWALRMAGIGLIHESNGQSDPLSRSWNRLYLGVGFDHRDMSIYARFWKRFPESRGSDDNPDITTYMGRADVRLNWDLKHGNTIGLGVVSNLRHSNKGSVQLDYYFPLSRFWGMGDYLRGYVQVFHGYGETITDYNFRRTALGIGFAIKEW